MAEDFPMGLEMAEFVIDLEEGFDIVIPDEAAQTAETVGDLVRLVEYLLTGREDEGAFLKKRAVLKKLLCERRLNPEQLDGSTRLLSLQEMRVGGLWPELRAILRKQGYAAPVVIGLHSTLDDMARSMVELPGIRPESEKISVRPETQETVIRLLCERIGARPEEIKLESRFVADLDMG